MATTEHALFCFETLAAHLAKRKPWDLDAVQKSYAEFVAEKTAADTPSSSSSSSAADHAKQLPALRRLAETLTPSSSSSSSSSLSLASSATSLSVAAADAPDIPDSPLFVTWNTSEGEDDGEHALRGCIGTFEAQPLEEGLATYALTAALGDTRFPPVGRRELPHLDVAVTLLTDFEPAAGGVDDWEIGRHGLRISFSHGGRRYGSTYLPDVAPEQGWTKEETMVSLMRKAGWTGRRDRWREVDVRVVRYQGARRELTYAEYKAWRDWADGKGRAAGGGGGK